MRQGMEKTVALMKQAVVFCLKGAGLVLFPPVCPGCNCLVSLTGAVCPRCWSQLQFLEKPFCPVMGLPFSFDRGAGFLSGEALSDPPPFDCARAVVEHDGLARKLVSRLKYASRTDLAVWMGAWMVRACGDLVADCDFVLPVPLHRRRFWQRGYNQSAELARTIARLQGRKFSPQLLIRRKYTRPQVGLGAKKRLQNVRGVFAVPGRARALVRGSHIVLVDDVYTTGATVRAATRALKRAGARRVDVITFSRVVKNHE